MNPLASDKTDRTVSRINTIADERLGFGRSATAADIDSKYRPGPPVITCYTSVCIALAK